MSIEQRLSLIFQFTAVGVSVFIFSYIFLYSVDFLPEPVSTNDEDTVVLVENDNEAAAESGARTEDEVRPERYPTRVIIDALDLDVEVINPQSRAIADLDEALLDGAVRHPDSADFLDEGHMFILGHSSYLPTVHNLNFRAFNGIQKLTWGDLIRVQSGNFEYVYRVTDVYEVNASVAEIDLNHSKPRLTLATCDSFGSKNDRFVVDAELIATEAL